MPMTDDLPLPEPKMQTIAQGRYGFTADQMRAYGDDREAAVQDDVGSLECQGRSVSFLHQKMCAYRKGLDDAWSALKAAGVRPDGNIDIAGGIARLAAQPAAQPRPALASIESAPACLNMNDKAVWVTGWNECLDAMAPLTATPTAPTKGE